MAITPIDPPRPIAQPAIAPIVPPSPQGARDGRLRVVVWFRPEVALPDDEIPCTPDTADALFGPGVAQRLLITPETAWLQRLLPGALAAALDEDMEAGSDADDVVRSTPYSHIYLLCLTGGPGVGHVCEVLGASTNVRLVHAEPTLVVAGQPTKYQKSAIFKKEQDYLKSPQGINAEPVWAKDYTGSGIQAGVVDTETSFSGMPYSPRIVPLPAGKGVAGGSSTVGNHGRIMAGILGCPDNDAMAIGAAPEVSLVFIGAPGVRAATGAAGSAAIGEMLDKGGLKPGDVVSMSIAVAVGLDIKQPYSEYKTLLAQNGTAAWPHRLLTEKVGADTRPSGAITAVPLEFDALLLKLVTKFIDKGITVVLGAGNGIEALCEPRGGKDWIHTVLGANLGGPWIAQVGAPWPGAVKGPVAAFRRGLATTATHSLDRATVAAFADGGGIVVSGSQFSSAAGGMIDNIQLNHGNRVDCCVTNFDGQALGFGGFAGAGFMGGSSLCTPVIAGAAAIVQGIAMKQFKAPLKPAIVRALLSDPDLGTPTVSGSPVGVMPDLEKLMTFLEKPQSKRADLLTAVQAQQQKSATRVKAAAAAQGAYVHDPYTAFTRAGKGPGSWQPLPLAAEGDLFAP
jgi:hypothetical protein